GGSAGGVALAGERHDRDWRFRAQPAGGAVEVAVEHGRADHEDMLALEPLDDREKVVTHGQTSMRAGVWAWRWSRAPARMARAASAKSPATTSGRRPGVRCQTVSWPLSRN